MLRFLKALFRKLIEQNYREKANHRPQTQKIRKFMVRATYVLAVKRKLSEARAG
jgi:hypothetical protein